MREQEWEKERGVNAEKESEGKERGVEFNWLKVILFVDAICMPFFKQVGGVTFKLHQTVGCSLQAHRKSVKLGFV